MEWQLSTKSEPLKEMQVSIRVSSHFGEDKFHTQLSSLSLSRRLSNTSTLMFSRSQRVSTASPLNSWSPSCPDILPVSSALWFRILLTPWYLSWTKQDKELVRSTRTLDSEDFGKVSEQEFSWLVPLLACNGSSTIPSRFGADLPPPEESEESYFFINFIHEYI